MTGSHLFTVNQKIWEPLENRFPGAIGTRMGGGKSSFARGLLDKANNDKVILVEEKVIDVPELETFYEGHDEAVAITKNIREEGPKNPLLTPENGYLDFDRVEELLDLVHRVLVLEEDIPLPEMGMEIPRGTRDKILGFQYFALQYRPKQHYEAFEAANGLILKDRLILVDISFQVASWIQNHIRTPEMLGLAYEHINLFKKMAAEGNQVKTWVYLDVNSEIAHQRNEQRKRDYDNVPEWYIRLQGLCTERVVIPLAEKLGIQVYREDWNRDRPITMVPNQQESWRITDMPEKQMRYFFK